MSNNSEAGKSFQEIWVGLDLGKSSFEAAIAWDSSHFTGRKFPTTREGVEQLLAWCDGELGQQRMKATVRFVMEATGSCSIRVFSWLHQLRPLSAPAIINPNFIKSFGESLGVRNKTDKADAQVIARYGYERRPVGEVPKTPQQERLQNLVRERQVLVEQSTAEKNRAGELCDLPELRKMRERRLELLKKQIAAIEKLIRQLVDKTPELKSDVKLLETIPGVGFIVATYVIAELGDLRRFADPRKLSAYCGLSPRQFTSGTSVRRRTRVSKMGNKRVRPLLHLASRALVGRSKYAYGKLYEDLVARGKTKSAAIAAVARRILVLMRAILISGKEYSNYIAGCGKHASQLCKTPGDFPCAA